MDDNQRRPIDAITNGNQRIQQVSSGSSIELNGDALQIAEPSRSEDLDKLSLCLSEAASEVDGSEQSTLFNEVLQSQLAFWTLVISIFYTYAWQQHRKKFLFSVVMVVPPVLLICMTLSMMLGIIVITGWLCSTPMNFGDVLTISNGDDGDGLNSMSASRSNLAGGRRRTMSGNRASIPAHVSRHFDRSSSARSSSCEDLTLPKPVCRKHSTEHGFSRGLSSAGASHSGSRYFTYQHDLIRAASNNAVTTSPIGGLDDSNPPTFTQSGGFPPIVETKMPKKMPKSQMKKSAQKTPNAKNHAKENHQASEKRSNGVAMSGGSRKNSSKDQEIVPDPPIHSSSIAKPFSSKN